MSQDIFARILFKIGFYNLDAFFESVTTQKSASIAENQVEFRQFAWNHSKRRSCSAKAIFFWISCFFADLVGSGWWVLVSVRFRFGFASSGDHVISQCLSFVVP